MLYFPKGQAGRFLRLYILLLVLYFSNSDTEIRSFISSLFAPITTVLAAILAIMGVHYTHSKQQKNLIDKNKLVFVEKFEEVDYEIEISPENELLVAKMRYLGIHPNNGPATLDIQFVPEEDCFVTSNVTRIPNGYVAEISLPKAKIITGDGPVYFNAYRLETDGGTMEKHLFALNPTLCGRFHTPSCYLPLDEYVTNLD